MSDCQDIQVALPMGIFVPTRGTATTSHADALSKTVVAITLPDDALAQTLLVTLVGKHTSGAVRLSFQFHVMITRLDSETPNAYSVDIATQHAMVNEDGDIEADIVENGDSGANITITDTSSDAGDIDWNYQIWVLDEIALS